MRAILLAAGKGDRLQPITSFIPKCIVPINGVPLIDYWLEQLFESGIKEVLINTHYLAEQVNCHIEKSKFRKKIKLVYEEELLNTGGSVISNKAFFNNESFMVVHADNLSFCNFNEFIKSHVNRNNNSDITMMTFKTDDPKSCGVVELNDDGLVMKFHEKVLDPPTELANGAVYIMEPSVIEYMESLNNLAVDLSLDVIPNYLGRISTFFNAGYHRDIGTVESYALSQIEISLRQNI